MPTSDYFSATYAEARVKFRDAARAADARLSEYLLPDLLGPRGEPLAVDVAVLGPKGPEAMLLLISGTHGVEGFCGSGCQVGYLADDLAGALPARAGAILVHGLNPYGFAWLRRVNEDNVDLNRNFMDFTQAPPDSSGYEALHDVLVPGDWDGPQRAAADLRLRAFMQKPEDFRALQAVVSAGQYTRPTGLFYGGTRPTWSNLTFRSILAQHLPSTVNQLVVLEFHSGLGRPAYGEPIYTGPVNAGLERAREWFGPEVKAMRENTAVAAVVAGSLAEAFLDLPAHVEVTHLTLEYGTRPILEVLTALRADHWLHAVPGRETPLRGAIGQQMRDAFYVDTPAWKAAVYGRAADFVLRACQALTPRSP